MREAQDPCSAAADRRQRDAIQMRSRLREGKELCPLSQLLHIHVAARARRVFARLRSVRARVRACDCDRSRSARLVVRIVELR